MPLPSSVTSSTATFGAVTPRHAQDTARRNALSDLIHSRRIELGMTWHELAKRGGFSSHTILYALATKAEHKQVPRPATLERVARALDLPLDVVKGAAAESAGYTMQEIKATLEDAGDLRIIAAAFGELTAEDKVKIRRMTEMFLEERRAAKRAKK